MSQLTIFLSKFIGLSTLLVSLSMIARKDRTVAVVTSLLQDRPLLFVLGLLMLFGGLAIVIGHNVWSGGVLPIVVTLVGWLVLIRGLLILLLPAAAIADFLELIRFEKLFYLYAAIACAIGLYLTYAGFRGGTAQRETRLELFEQ